MKSSKLVLGFFVLVLFYSSCSKDDSFLVEEGIVNEKISNDISRLQNGKRKLKNPYSVKNMNKALKNLKLKINDKKIKTKGSKAQELERSILALEFNTTYRYIKFSPNTKEQENLLKNDSDLYLFDYPLDYEYSPDYLDNRQIPSDSIFQYYTAVPIEKVLPSGVQFEILENLYIPEEDPFFDEYDTELEYAPNTRRGEVGNNEDILRHLLYEAFEMTDNLTDLIGDINPDEMENTFWIFGSKWYPSGNLKHWDKNAGITITTERVFSHYETYDCEDSGGPSIDPIKRELLPIDQCQRAIYKNVTTKEQGKFVPLDGAQVLMRQWFTVRQGITDSNGNFNTGSVRGKARYIIQWERYHYSIRNGSLFQAETRGPKLKEQSWNYNVKGGDDEYHAMIHAAAHDYYYGNRFGLTSPPRNKAFKKQLKIAARENGDVSSFSHTRNFLTFGLFPQIHIKQWGSSSDRVYGITIHELAHGAHSEVDRDSYDNIVRDAHWSPWQGSEVVNNNTRLLESWARAVETVFTLHRYRTEFQLLNYNYRRLNLQNLEILDENHYTSGGYDMIDNFNQRQFGISFPQDRVSGYTIKQLEDGLVFARSWYQWRDNIKARFNNPTEIYLNELFANWPD